MFYQLIKQLLLSQDDFVIQCRMSNKPYDFFGTWYNDSYLLSGDLRWLAHLVSTSIVWLNRASQETDSEYTSIMNRMFRFYNRSASSIRSITVANCHRDNFHSQQPTHSSNTSSPPTSLPASVVSIIYDNMMSTVLLYINLYFFNALSEWSCHRKSCFAPGAKLSKPNPGRKPPTFKRKLSNFWYIWSTSR